MMLRGCSHPTTKRIPRDAAVWSGGAHGGCAATGWATHRLVGENRRRLPIFDRQTSPDAGSRRGIRPSGWVDLPSEQQGRRCCRNGQTSDVRHQGEGSGPGVARSLEQETLGDLLDEKLSRRAVKDIQSGLQGSRSVRQVGGRAPGAGAGGTTRSCCPSERG